MLTATVSVDLDLVEPGYWQDVDKEDRRALMTIDDIPDGARLIVNVGDRDLLMPSAPKILCEHSDRLNIEIAASSPQSARRWYDAIKAGEVVW